MDIVPLRYRIARTPLAAAAAFPVRARLVGRYDWPIIRESAKWLVHSREFTNWTYDLTPLNMGQLAWFVANLTRRPVDEIRGYMDELLTDSELAAHITQTTLTSDLRRLADSTPKYGRRLGWYAIVRALRPAHVVETGTDKGLGSVVFAAALLRNGTGRLTTIDDNPLAGYLIAGRWASVIDYARGDSHEVLGAMTAPIALFIHDSEHTVPHESAEYRLIEPLLTPTSVVLSDNADVYPTLMHWAETRGWRFDFFREQPAGHWFGGCGIGVAYQATTA